MTDTWQPIGAIASKIVAAIERKKAVRTPEQQQAVYERRKLRRKQNPNCHNAVNHTVPPEPEPPPEVLAERDARMALEPQSITAALCGDPPRDHSALDRRP